MAYCHTNAMPSLSQHVMHYYILILDTNNNTPSPGQYYYLYFIYYICLQWQHIGLQRGVL